MTRLAVIMPVYNEGERLKTAIQSIMDQEFQDFILFICDDGSTDETRKIISAIKFAARYPIGPSIHHQQSAAPR